MFENMGDSLRLAFRDALSDLFAFIPRLFGAVVLVLVGWIAGKIVGGLVTRGLRAIRFNEIADKAEIDDFLRNAGVKMDPAAVVGSIARWFIYLTFFLAAFNALGLPQVSAVIDDVLTFLPKVVVAVVILLVGALAGTLLAGVVRGALRSMGLQNPDLFATIARFAVIAFALIAALDMLAIAPNIVNGLWMAFLATIAGTVALAFGLGGREAARDLTLGRMLRAELEPGVEVQAGAHQGRVRTIGSLFTTLETQDGIVKVPNAQLTGQPLRMSPQQYQQQIDKREQMKQQAREALQPARGGSQPAPAAPAGRRTQVVTATGRRDDTDGRRTGGR